MPKPDPCHVGWRNNQEQPKASRPPGNSGQNRTPLFDAITEYVNRDPAYFRIPGHRGAAGINRKWTDIAGPEIFRMDLTETPLLDDLHNPSGAIAEAQGLAADFFGAERSWFLVNGTTCGNEAMVIAAAGEGETILIPRNAHKSVLMGLIVSGATPEYLTPAVDPEWGVLGGITPAQVEAALSRLGTGEGHRPPVGKRPRAALIVTPSYYGLCSDTAGIASVCHSFGVPLLVDEAHGAHLYASPLLPAGALAAGADVCSQSIHKVAGSLTQSSMLHIRSSLLDSARLEGALHILQSTSPSYLLMVSLDLAREELALRGRESVCRAISLAESARDRVNRIPGFRCIGKEIVGRAGIAGIAPPRRGISGTPAGVNGFLLKQLLFNRHAVDVELADWNNVVAIITGANTEEEIDRLVSGLREIGAAMGSVTGRIGGGSDRLEGGVSASGHDSGLDSISGAGGRPLPPALPSPLLPPLPPRALTPRQAFFATKRAVPWNEHRRQAAGGTEHRHARPIGLIAGEMIAPYPPGIPVIYPGEILTEEIWEYIDRFRREGLHIQGPADRDLGTFRVVEE